MLFKTNQHPLEEFIDESAPFLNEICTHLTESNIDVSHLELDHICYRVPTTDLYEQHKRQFIQHGVLLSEAHIAGRPIATYKLKTPIIYQEITPLTNNTSQLLERQIYLIELPAPKEPNSYSQGFEHAEFVLTEPFASFIAKHPAVKFNTNAMTKKHNPDISLKFPTCSIKFHLQSLEDVIKYEQAVGM